MSQQQPPFTPTFVPTQPLRSATLTITELPTGGVNMEVDFGDEFDPKSQAHGLVAQLAEAVLGTAKHYSQVEDTAPEVDIEPSRIITPN